ncbi:MAG: radical SAM protein [Clostridia bacterium]|nr:radical SAM protein [Clostridia bacterium]
MKNVYFVQVDVSATYGQQNAYLPYTAGILAAAAFESETVKKYFEFKGFVFLRDDPHEVAAKMDDPAIVAFSCYCWNTEYNKRLAEEIKKLHPSCLIVFGGHNVPDNFDMLESFPYVDILCHGEGENTVRCLFEAVAEGTGFENVPNISFRGKDGFVRTESVCQRNLDFPSPYLSGMFDRLVEENPDIIFNAILETSRGCPNQCAYCDWGLLKSKVRLFPLERVKGEIKWMSDHKVAFVWGADANFGLFSRDLEIADALVEAKEKTGYPERMRVNYAKNKFDNVFAIIRKFKECDFDRVGATLSFQSLSPEVLHNIGRTNNDTEFYKKLLTKYNKENMKTYSELILGMPGETYESFIHGIGTILDIGQHFVFDVYSCVLLPNSAMGQKDYVEKHGIKTVRSEIVRLHFRNEAYSIPEYNDIIVETNTMSRDMWIKSTVFQYLARAFHGNGLLRAFAIYLRYNKDVPYERFYDGMLTYFEENPDLFVSGLYNGVKTHAKEFADGKIVRKLLFEPCGDVVWDDHEYCVLNALNNFDTFYDEMTPYLASYGIDETVFRDLLAYQKGIMRRPCSHECTAQMDYDVHTFLTDAYVNNIHPLEAKKHTLVMRDSDPVDDWQTFGKKVIWYGRMGWASYKDDVEIKTKE